MSEQPASAVPSSTAIVSGLEFGRNDIRASPLRQIQRVAGELARQDASASLRLSIRDLGLAHQEQIGIVDRQRRVERRLDRVTRTRRANEARRDDDREIGLVLL